MEALFSDYEDIRKSGLFDAAYYVATYPDVAERNLDPLVHFLEEGARQGRNPHADFDSAFYLEQCQLRGEEPGNPLLHYIRVGAARGLKPRRDNNARGAGQDSRPEPTSRAARAPVLVVIEAVDAASAADGAARFTVTGWALAAAPIAEISLSVDGQVRSIATYGLARPDVARIYPDRAGAADSGFILAFELAGLKSGVLQPRLIVRTANGEIGQRPFNVEIPPQAFGPDGKIREMRLPIAAGTKSGQDPDHTLHIDTPVLLDGVAETPLRGNLLIGGWALARAGVAEIEVAIDGSPMTLADYGLRRLDIAAAFPDWDGAAVSGFAALVPHRVLTKGSHAVTLTLRDKAGGTTRSEFGIQVEEVSDAPGPWLLRRKMGQAEIDLDRRILERCGRHPMFIVVMPVKGEAASRRAGVTIASLVAQAYANWRLLVVPQGAAASVLTRDRLCAGLSASDERITVTSGFGRDALEMADIPAAEMFLSVVSPGDELGVDALVEMAIAAAMHPDADFCYSDERCHNPASGEIEAFFKPQWSPDLMLSANYIGRLWCARADLVVAIADPDTLLGHGEFDLLLRCTEAAKAIRHVARVLCERGDARIDGAAQSRKALGRALSRRGIAGEILAGQASGSYRVRRALAAPALVSIIIPTRAERGLIERCVTTLRRLTAYRDYEIICIENIPPADRKWRDWLRLNADRVISVDEGFNWARFNNLAALDARGDYLLFLNDDIEIIDPDWLDALLGEAQRPEVGVVGPRLLYPDRRVQHAGMFLAAMGQARHAFRYAAEDAPGYFGLALTQRNVIAVTGACLLTRRSTFEALGGFDEAHAIVNNDLDFCLRAWRSGLVNIYTPHASLIHHEAVSRAALADEYDVAAFDGKWRELFLAGDPYFSPHLAKTQDHLAIDREPTEVLVTGRPVLRREDIRKILVVKLDHIGDCVIAFPAVRRLHRLFPDARIAVLTSHASRPVWRLEPSVAETIAFDFFHARSGEGEIKRSAKDWRDLRARLLPERFDLAVDLRKHAETRPVLQCTGAGFVAGFDFRNEFPWLDIALEWTGDQVYVRKRQHNGDDLLNLVDAIAAACDGDRDVIATRRADLPAARPQSSGGRPLVCVHPTVGNDARQWPIEHFVAVIDRLVEADAAQVVLIGGPGDEEVAADILRQVRHPKAVRSLVGKVPLADLPGLLAGMSLFLGNNSGPKHIAAGLGVPTVGVHSGTEDVREWGPIGPSALAVARDVVCAPCYLANAADCRRGLACLRELEPARVYDACKRLLLLGGPVQRPARGRSAAARRRPR